MGETEMSADRTERVELTTLCLLTKGSALSTVTDFMQVLKVFDDDTLTEFQYVPDGDNWKVCLK